MWEEADTRDGISPFDEADALSGKRSQMELSRDRQANVEVAHLLESIESPAGAAMLSTNESQSPDPAFM